MKIEIERKFLLASDRWRAEVQRSAVIRDGIIAASLERKTRIRIIGSRATITVKTRRINGAREEFEYDIPLADAERLLAMCGDVISKRRHYVAHAGLMWEIDEYDGLLEGIVLAEVELQSVAQEVVLPDWVGAEVTEEESYRKINLLRARQSPRIPNADD